MLKPYENSHAETSQDTGVIDLHTVKPSAHVLTLRIGADQHPGLRYRYRPNEDTLFVMQGHRAQASSGAQPFILLGVADGMGGQGHGRKASRLAASSLADYVFDALCHGCQQSDDLLSVLIRGVQHANQMIYESNQCLRTVMGTTLTVALISETTAYIAHVGDSRCYLQREPAGLVRITHDHSFVAQLVEHGIITPDEVYTHPRRNLINRCLGDQPAVEVDTLVLPLVPRDTLLVCSDGLWEMVRDPQINTILRTPLPGPSDTACELIQAALESGGDDNISAIVVQVDDEDVIPLRRSDASAAYIAANQMNGAINALAFA